MFLQLHILVQGAIMQVMVGAVAEMADILM
jgi:hypothetical protein